MSEVKIAAQTIKTEHELTAEEAAALVEAQAKVTEKFLAARPESLPQVSRDGIIIYGEQ
jgi:hypothetical protein